MEKNILILNEYRSNLLAESNNLNNLSLNIIGESFFGLQRKLIEFKQMIDNMAYQVGKRIKMFDGFPITSFKEIEEISAIKSMQSRCYTGNQILEVLENDFQYLIDYTTDMLYYFCEHKDIYTKLILEDNLKELTNEYWNIKSTLK